MSATGPQSVANSQPPSSIAHLDRGGGGGLLNHVHQYPADNTFVSTISGAVYRFAGGAPIYVSDWAAVGGQQPTTLVDSYTLDRGDGGGLLNHVHQHPADNTFVSTISGAVYRFAGGDHLRQRLGRSRWPTANHPRR